VIRIAKAAALAMVLVALGGAAGAGSVSAAEPVCDRITATFEDGSSTCANGYTIDSSGTVRLPLMLPDTAAPTATPVALLGASVESHIYRNEDRFVTVQSHATVPVVFEFETTGGWAVEPTSLTLAPDELAAVEVVAAGEEPAPLVVRVRAVDYGGAAMTNDLAFTANLLHERPVDWTLVVAVVGFVLVAATVAAFVVLRGRRAAAADRARWLARV
jgi:hypothetical protein